MFTSKSSTLAVTFFCALGWVCDASANGDDLVAQLTQAVQQAAQTGGPAAAGAPVADGPGAPAPRVFADNLVAPEKVAAKSNKNVSVTKFDTVSLNVQNTELANVLQLLSIQGRRNIVPSPKVTGSVTANLYDVTFHEALDAILQQNGAGYIEKGNFIYIYTLDELKKIQDAERRVTHRLFRLNYMTAADAAEFCKPLLSSAGSISISGAVAAGFKPTESDGGANSYAQAETLVVRDYPENIEEIARTVGLLDTRPSQVLVEATILQADLTEDLAFGVDLAILADIGIGATGVTNPLTAISSMISGAVQSNPTGGVQSNIGNTGRPGGVKAGVLTNNVAAFIRALDQVTDTVILANPKLMTLNRQRAEVLVGDKIAYLSTTATATATTQTVEFLDTGTKLSMRPFVSDDGMIRLELKPSISSATIREGSDPPLPDEKTQELTTNVMVPDGRTVVLGGLFKEQTTIGRSQVPFLGDIPIAGNAFKSRDDQLKRSEVIFLITPHIVKDKALSAAAEVAKEGIEQVRIGQMEYLLPWSRSKQSAGHVRDALKHLESNETDKALWEVDEALRLDPEMAEGRRLKEKLTGQRTYWPGASLLDESVEVMIQEQTGQRRQPNRPVVPSPAPEHTQPGPGNTSAPLSGGDDATETKPVEPAKDKTSAYAPTVTPGPVTDDVVIVPAIETIDTPPQPVAPAPENTEPAAPVEPANDATNGAEAEKKNDAPVTPAPAPAAETPAAPAPAPEAPKAEEAKPEQPAKPEEPVKVSDETQKQPPSDPQTDELLKDFGKAK